MISVVVDTDGVSYGFKNHPFGSRYDAAGSRSFPS